MYFIFPNAMCVGFRFKIQTYIMYILASSGPKVKEWLNVFTSCDFLFSWYFYDGTRIFDIRSNRLRTFFPNIIILRSFFLLKNTSSFSPRPALFIKIFSLFTHVCTLSMFVFRLWEIVCFLQRVSFRCNRFCLIL